MYLNELEQKVQEAKKMVLAAGGDPADTPVMVDSAEEADLEIIDFRAEEFPDDEETYREHVRVGGKREFSVHISVGDS